MNEHPRRRLLHPAQINTGMAQVRRENAMPATGTICHMSCSERDAAHQGERGWRT